MSRQRKKVLVGISGGVDSAVSLALLQEKNYAVGAVFLCFPGNEGKNKKALADAKNICTILDIPLTIINAQKKFEETVVKYFIDEYAHGNTPNPCVFCNEKMKFKLLFETADKLGVEMVATGHYAKILPTPMLLPLLKLRPTSRQAGMKPAYRTGRHETYSMKRGITNTEQEIGYKLFPASDKQKDQSYFLYRLTQKRLARIIFPLGDYQKADVRKLAEKFKLPVFDKSDSQDVCFMAENNLEKFLATKISLKKGKIIDLQGKVLGEHRGLPLYTIGQRKGIEIGGTGPYFVVDKNFKKNELMVTNQSHHLAINQKITELKNVVWTNGVAPKLPLTATVRTRYHSLLVCAIIRSIKNRKTYQLEFETPQKAVSPGQSVVFYAKDGEILGGGIIKH